MTPKPRTPPPLRPTQWHRALIIATEGLLQSQIADDLGVCQQTVGRYLRGGKPDTGAVIAASAKYGLDVSLLGRPVRVLPVHSSLRTRAKRAA